MDAKQIANKIEAADVEAFAWLLELEFTHDAEAEDAKKTIVLALRFYADRYEAAMASRPRPLILLG